MKALIDTNVILDVWLEREPFAPDSAQVLALVERGKLQAIIAPTSITTLHNLAKKQRGEQQARKLIKALKSLCKVGKLGSPEFDHALESPVKDFEDAVLEAVAVTEQAEVIITRNSKDFHKSKIPALEPVQLLND